MGFSHFGLFSFRNASPECDAECTARPQGMAFVMASGDGGVNPLTSLFNRSEMAFERLAARRRRPRRGDAFSCCTIAATEESRA